MRSSWHYASGEFLEVAARSPDFSLVTALLLKKSLRAAERKRDDVARKRRRWIREQGLLDPARLVFIDETAITTNMVRPNGWSPRGERLVGEVPMGHWETLTFIAGFRQTGIVAPMLIKGAMNGRSVPRLGRTMSRPHSPEEGHRCRRQRLLPQGRRRGGGNRGPRSRTATLAGVLARP